MKKYLWILLAGVAMFAFVAVSCGGDDDAAADSDSDVANADGADEDSDMDTGEAGVSITLIPLDNFTFETPELRVKVGESIRLTLDNSNSSTLHDFTVRIMPVDDVRTEGAEDVMDLVAVHVAADAGEVGVVTFTPTEAGTYEFECSAGDGSHKAAGMIGTIVVS